MITLYGIGNCDSCRKARAWLDAQGFAHHYHDLRRDGLDEKKLDHWIGSVGWETLLNRRGTTWRQLSDAAKTATNTQSAPALMLDNVTLIKRPIIENGTMVTVGFDEAMRASLSGRDQ
jgi:arsenate reductase